MSIEIKDIMLYNNLRLIYTQCNIDQSRSIKIRLLENKTIKVEVLDE